MGSYITTTGEAMARPPRPAAELRAEKVAALKGELRQLDAAWDETAEQLVTLQNRRAKIAERRRSIRRTVEAIERISPFNTEEKH